MSMLSALQHQTWMDYATSNQEDKNGFLLCMASSIAPFPLWAGFAALGSSLFLWVQVLWTVVGIGVSIWALCAVISIVDGERYVRKLIKKAAKDHVSATIDGSDTYTLSERIRKDSPKGYHWGWLRPRHLRWIEHAYQSALKEEMENRAENKRIDNDHYGSFASIDGIGSADSRAVRDTKSFLKGLDEIYAESNREQISPKKKEFADFDEKMRELTAQSDTPTPRRT